MEENLHKFFIHTDLFPVMAEGGESATSIAKVLAMSQDFSGLFFLENTDGYQFLIDNGYILPVNRIIDFVGKTYNVKNMFILNGDFLWHGFGWMRGIYDYIGGTVKYRGASIAVVDILEEAKTRGFIFNAQT